MTAMATEIMSNLTTTIILFPIVSKMAVALGINPLYLLLPQVNASSFAFMLPIGTAPNTLVFATGDMKTWDMAKPGIFMNVLCVAVQMLMINSLGSLMFDVHNFPEWANNTAMLQHKMPINETLLNNATKVF
ncbi:Na(+)/citrate cotransporter-like [Parasteatoda tepidariorum]|uniref:Na(+)/citrate cotransporter-like n=1 Tax=Parasteatoda tepidariorum TaxID=114398 RepID=UPI001C71DEE0|nr:solute carrier family 13 member 5-like [Parasteatoda tepidariorum]